MADITIRFKYNEETGEKEIIVDFESEDDVMRHEHEKGHRDFIGQLLPEVSGEAVERISPGSVVRPEVNAEQQPDQLANEG